MSVQLGVPDKLLMFLRFGAQIFMGNEQVTVFEHLLNRLTEFNHVYPYNLVSCLQLLLRTVPQLTIDRRESIDDYPLYHKRMLERYSDLIEDGIIPLNRCGIVPAELKHLCRCAVRNRLWQNYQLPNGIRLLPVPDALHRYLDILED